MKRAKKGVCKFWAKAGTCTKGKDCDFRHEGPAAGAAAGAAGGAPRAFGRGRRPSQDGAPPHAPHRARPAGRGGLQLRGLAADISAPPPGAGPDAGPRAGGAGGGGAAGGQRRADQDCVKFVKHLCALKSPAELEAAILRSLELWARAWGDAARLEPRALEGLVECLGRLPNTAAVPPPPARRCQQAVCKYLDERAAGDEAQASKAVDVVLNAVRRLLQFRWEAPPEEVRGAIEDTLTAASAKLRPTSKDFMPLAGKINALMTEANKPWSIKQPHAPTPADAPPTRAFSDWKTADVRWLANPHFFRASALPIMSVPGSKSGGVYDSKEEYLDTVQRLWVGMTFSDGNGALTPKCRQHGCKQVLWPLKGGAGGLACRTKGCGGGAVVVCSHNAHRDALCEQCLRRESATLMGAPGPRAATDIYDGTVSRVDAEGRLYVQSFQSRNPPQHAIHWRSSRRLQSPSLVGIVRLHEFGAPLRLSDPITWGEITYHGHPKDESGFRDSGQVAINLASICNDFDSELFKKGDAVCLIDCQSFVPEFIPVLKTQELLQLNSLPFEEGQLLNLCRSSRQDLNTCLQTGDGLDLSDIPSLISDMIEESTLEPIAQIRRDPTQAAEMQRLLVRLVEKATLDNMQLVSFIHSLRNAVHLTQGPPGTGKSYLGVVIVRALLIIRTFWIKVNPSVGNPPILVLSYKNHAIDEFLCDLVAAEPRGLSMIRIGGSCNEPRLDQYSERNAKRQDSGVKACKRSIDDLHALLSDSRKVYDMASSFLAYKTDIFEAPGADDNASAMHRAKVSYEAAERLAHSLIRCKLLADTLGKIKEREAAGLRFLAGQSDFSFLSEEDLTRSSHAKSFLASGKIFESISTLYEGIKHYSVLEVEDILLHFIQGAYPLPLCSYPSCKDLARSHSGLCDAHQCSRLVDGEECPKPVERGKSKCFEHVCGAESCSEDRILAQDFCKEHACFVCVEEGIRAGLATDESPRNVCSMHPLCSIMSCSLLCHPGSDYCPEHIFVACSGITKAGKNCTKRAISQGQRFCVDHIDQMRFGRHDGEDLSEASDSSDEEDETCIGITKKKIKCKSLAAPRSKYCVDHASQDFQAAMRASKEMAAQIKSAEQKAVAADVENEASKEPKTQAASSKDQIPVDESVPSAPIALGADVTVDALGIDSQGVAAGAAGVLGKEPSLGEDEDDFESASEGMSENERYDNQDEVDENDNLLHLRDVFEVPASDSSGEEVEDDEEDAEAAQEGDDSDSRAAARRECADSSKWTWEMPLEERWDACQAFMDQQMELLKEAAVQINRQLRAKRQDLHSEKIRSSATIYENKVVIGGTIVGCISRLEAIRSARPFAIIVEEASEVMEPLLSSCLCTSNVKFEMIGDHLQLQPSMMSKFEYERMNKINCSMFERLIRAPASHRVPSSVLAVQRRMRGNICDLTRLYYKEIIEIQDHTLCSTRCIPGSTASKSVTQGREVPGVQPHLFLWTHTGKQGKARVGLSRVNEHEAKMTCGLAEYLVECGVPRPSIAILTPYKGQLMLIRDILLKSSKSKLLSRNPGVTNVCRVSTVDRFQGDEADVIIVSLVVDEDSNTPFVKQQNRMIVLLSRARIGMYVIGNQGYFEKGPSPHWVSTFQMLQEPAPSDSASILKASPLVFGKPRIGTKLPLCCPQHRDTTMEVSDPSRLKLNFCKAPCSCELPCSHPCGLQCHWPKEQHNTKCETMIASPCSKHGGQLTCNEVFKSLDSSSRMLGYLRIDQALPFYRCKKRVEVTLPCTHMTTMECCEESEIIDKAKPWPECQQPAHNPYVYPDCKHSLACTCCEFQKYTESPSSVKNCSEQVHYFPSCGHALSIPCYHKKYLESGARFFVCPKHITVELPRCRHKAQVSCTEEARLRSWTGEACEVVGVVREGEDYGPKDMVCKEKVKFVHRCGHEQVVPCEQAFDMSKVHVVCEAKEEIINPHCGHPCKVSCADAIKLSELPRGSRIDSLVEGDEERVLPPDVKHINCSHKVSLQRKCGHTQEVTCAQTYQKLSPCAEAVKAQSPLCGHEVTVPCHMQAFSGCAPWSKEVFDSLVREGILPHGWRPQGHVPQHFADVLNCGGSVQATSECGHSVEVKCANLVSLVREGQLKIKCKEKVQKPLACGHVCNTECWRFRDYQQGRSRISCSKTVPFDCWNAQVCGTVGQASAKCGSATKFACDRFTTWTCEAGMHSFDLKLCVDGAPNKCPGCEEDMLRQAIQDCHARVESRASLAGKHLPPGLLQTKRVSPADTSEELVVKYNEGQAEVLAKFLARTSTQSLSQRQLFTGSTITVFFILQGNAEKSKRSFSDKDAKAKTLFGIRVHPWTQGNLRKLAAGVDENQSVSLLVGHGIVTNPLENPEWPSKNHRNKAINKRQDEGYDVVSYVCEPEGLETLVFWAPYALIATHFVKADKSDLLNLATEALSQPPASLSPETITFAKPEGIKPFRCAQSARSSAPPRPPPPSDSARANDAVQPLLANSEASGLTFSAGWSKGLCAERDVLGRSVEGDLLEKLRFANRDAPPFKGKQVLDNLVKMNQDKDGQQALLSFVDLLFALELDALGHPEVARTHLDKYMEQLRGDEGMRAHPLALVALARLCGSPAHATTYLKAFALVAPKAEDRWLKDGEKESVLDRSDDDDAEEETRASAPMDAAGEWRALQEKVPSCRSDAMDKLLGLTGLKKVKQAAVKLFKLAIGLQKMDPKRRKANTFALNYCFLGNPGTGKTTVAKLFAEILRDSQMRSMPTCVECTSQKVKDDGIDKFRSECVAKAMGGVLFIDEAYDLDPSQDSQGRKIVNELLTLTEDRRDEISVILAGYEDDMNDKFFSYNKGLKSRFQEIMFADFNKDELRHIWTTKREERGWREPDENLTSLVVWQLDKMSNRKGFGNARAVRQKLESAIQHAVSRDNFDHDHMELEMVDVLGEDPKHNAKLLLAKQELMGKIGWGSIKQSVSELMDACFKNYELQMQGKPPQPVFLNRLFLGNPGTGKTTCAGIYGRVLKELNFLSNGEVVAKVASDFVGAHVGESQTKTVEIIEAARGKVLVIDEAYILDDTMYGKQVLDTIVERVQGSEHDDIAVLLLGYDQQMMAMLRNQNPGLKRRFPPQYAFRFQDYSDDELLQILQKLCKEKQVLSSPSFEQTAIRILSMSRKTGNFGNAGEVQLLVQSAIQKASSRLAGQIATEIRLQGCDLEDGIHTLGSALASLDKLEKMDNVRAKITELFQKHVVSQQEGTDPPDLGHFVFTGSPGTGKTTVARSLKDILFRLKLLTVDRVVETTGLQMMGQYLGQTAPKVAELLREAKGGVLFIDEAYELGKGQYGTEACTALVEGMTQEEHKATVVIIAGYSEDIDGMLKTNPGLRNRFTNFLEFPDWDAADCVKSFRERAERERFLVDEAAFGVLERGFSGLISCNGWGNARDCGKVWEAVMGRRAKRVVGSVEMEKTITKTDVQDAVRELLRSRGGVEGDEDDKDADPLEALDKLYKMDAVKSKLRQLRDGLIVAEREGRSGGALGHFVFTGSPGTGKTTVARVMAKVLNRLKLLTCNKIKETSGLQMMGQFVGHTAPKVAELLKEAKGGVLFIDEAYELGKGQYGVEACTTLVEGMTKPEHQATAVIIAGYSKDIDGLLRTNEGLESRFRHFIEFPDWDAADCVKFFRMRAEKQAFLLPSEAEQELSTGFERMCGSSGWGNGRSVESVWEAVQVKRAARVVHQGEKVMTISEDDVRGALDEILSRTEKSRGALDEATARTDISSGQPFLAQGAGPGQRPAKMHQTAAPESAKDDVSATDRAAEETCVQSAELEQHMQDGSFEMQTAAAAEVREETEARVDEELAELAEALAHVDMEEKGSDASDEQRDEGGEREVDGRDPGVSDEDWEELQRSKERFASLEEEMQELLRLEAIRAEEEKMAQAELEERLERIRQQAEDREREEQLRLEMARQKEMLRAQRAARREREREAQRVREELQKARAIQEKLRRLRPCPAGFDWHQVGGGWRCGGGSHFVSDAELRSTFMQ